MTVMSTMLCCAIVPQYRCPLAPSPGEPHILDMRSPAPLRLSAPALLLLTTGCAALGSAWNYIITERPPYPLRAIDLSSDARIDSTGIIVGTFVGTGTDERVTLLSSDTGFISALAHE